MIQNKVVVRYADNRLQKGVTVNFSPDREIFHLGQPELINADNPKAVRIADLKAIFFVKDFNGNPYFEERKNFDPGKAVFGRKIKVVFQDGELLVGSTTSYRRDRPGFFVIPADPESNIERCFVVVRATKEVQFI
ncbi:MAG: hypothetical protein EG826_03415 [Deltaproteobacteria bacterium]|nr:hypothetical protein [Deltaproteobacteria bacterium]